MLSLILFLVILMVGGNPQHDAFGFRHWKNPGLFNEYVSNGSWGKQNASYCFFSYTKNVPQAIS